MVVVFDARLGIWIAKASWSELSTSAISSCCGFSSPGLFRKPISSAPFRNSRRLVSVSSSFEQYAGAIPSLRFVSHSLREKVFWKASGGMEGVSKRSTLSTLVMRYRFEYFSS